MPVLQSKPQQSNNYVSTNPNLNQYASALQPIYSAPQSRPGSFNLQGNIQNAPIPSTGGQVLGASTSSGGGIGSSGQASAPAGNQTLTNNINSQLSSGLDSINSGYNDYVSQLDTQQGNLQRSAADATSGVDVNAQGARNQLNNQLSTNNQAFDEQSQQANKQAGSATQQARDLYRQLQQQNVAQLSGSGLSSSSVAEALAENLGVETARRIAGVTGSRDEVLQNISKEKTNQQNYVQQQLTDLEGKVGAAKNSIQTQLLNSIDQLNNQRNVAASQKANARQQLISDAQGQIANLQAQAQNFQQSLQQWQAQNSSALQKTAVDFSGLSQAANAVQGLAQAGLAPGSAITNYLNSQGVQTPSDYAYQIPGGNTQPSLNGGVPGNIPYNPNDPLGLFGQQ